MDEENSIRQSCPESLVAILFSPVRFPVPAVLSSKFGYHGPKFADLAVAV